MLINEIRSFQNEQILIYEVEEIVFEYFKFMMVYCMLGNFFSVSFLSREDVTYYYLSMKVKLETIDFVYEPWKLII